jgi:hypothetical protein
MRPLICCALTAVLLLVIAMGCEKTIKDVRTAPSDQATLASR